MTERAAEPGPTRPGADPPRSPPSTVIVFEDGGSRSHLLPPTGELSIGRGDDCDLRLTDAGASRRHAALRVDGDRLTVVDLGSYNGTWVNGERVAGERALRRGDAVMICGALIVVHGGASPHAVLVDEATLHGRLAAEFDRAQRYHRSLTIVAVRFAAPAARDQAGPALCASVRPADTVGVDGGCGCLVLVPELELDQLGPALAALAGGLRGRGAQLGWARFPDDGVELETLLTAARSAAGAAPIGATVSADGLARRLRIGDATIMIADPTTVRAFAMIERLAVSDLPLLVLGETGVGKDSAALAVHHFSRRSGPVRTINCAAIPEHLVESELFGHERGAFSGAIATRPGLFESAAGGTVFLDEIAELPLAAQAKLLRVLDGKPVARIGSVEERAHDVRVVAATHRELRAEIAAGRFREDLYYRLSGAVVTLAPLRARRRELPLLARELLARARSRQRREPATLTTAAMQALARYPWPGNIRELRNAMDYAAVAAEGDEIDVWHLPPTVAGDLTATATATADVGEPSASDARPPSSFRPIADEVRALERRRMAQALAVAGGVQTRAAELLAMPRRTFVAKMRAYELHEVARP